MKTISGAKWFRLSLAIGVAIGVVTGLLSDRWPVGLLLVVIVTAALYVLWAFTALWRMNPARTQAHAGQADVNDEIGDVVLLLILTASLTAIGILLRSANDADKAAYAGMSLAAILMVWSLLHTMYAARYARLYYDGVPGGIDFNSDAAPQYSDFFYFSFNLGMTYQVSDTSVTTSGIRAEVLRHCLFSYIYGTVIIACTINLVINLVG
ncbi:putative membrane protein [Mycobacterium sp. OTB74]|nr:putative membrane protein [Mycobacterium sp. OTB74]